MGSFVPESLVERLEQLEVGFADIDGLVAVDRDPGGETEANLQVGKEGKVEKFHASWALNRGQIILSIYKDYSAGQSHII